MDADHREQMERLSRLRDSVRLQQQNQSLEHEPTEFDNKKALVKAEDGNIAVAQFEDPLIYPGLYSPSGFDIMSILIRVATRPYPQINMGAVDSSCALVLCDLSQPDIPIVYCSEPFEILTGYGSAEILGRNCRFLQSPSGAFPAGFQRPHDDGRLIELKNHILAKKEAQTMLVNYKKGGQPFTNILTTIPISWADDQDVQYIVGFQVDMGTCYT